MDIIGPIILIALLIAYKILASDVNNPIMKDN
jgi:hypothetical protein